MAKNVITKDIEIDGKVFKVKCRRPNYVDIDKYMDVATKASAAVQDVNVDAVEAGTESNEKLMSETLKFLRQRNIMTIDMLISIEEDGEVTEINSPEDVYEPRVVRELAKEIFPNDPLSHFYS